ncbi:MAG: VCBS repeat-containing protein [Deltaproteobacteria bacterium]|nr:VCBS repeat-containing protein [Deltaproteobacteria bacterium]
MARTEGVGIVLTAALAAVLVGCPGDPMPPPADSGADTGLDTGTTDTGTPDTGGDVPGDTQTMCPQVDFITPTDMSVLGVQQDLDMNCSNGFTAAVRLATNAPVGTMLELQVNGRTAGMVRVTSPTVTFGNVTLDTGGMSTLAVRASGVTTACRSIGVRVDCMVPRCQLTQPTRSTLNAMDSTSGGMTFATDFVVSTDIEDGRQVQLAVSGSDTPLRASVTGGRATFSMVPLSPDGMFRVRATCTNAAGNTGQSAETTFTVDSTPPTLTVASPMSGATIGLMADVNEPRMGTQFRVCGRSDAAGRRLCAAVEGAMPDDPAGCAVVPAGDMDACVEVTCPTGNAPFNVTVNTDDAAGNARRVTLTGIRCQSTLPSVRVVRPLAYATGMASTILNAGRDSSPMMPGVQQNVVACVDRMAGTATLLVNGVVRTETATVIAAVGTDPCGMLGMGFMGTATFTDVTLPDSSPSRILATDPDPANPTLAARVTDAAGDVGTSPMVTLYVDSAPPSIAISGCGRTVSLGAGMSATTDIDVESDSFPLTLTVTHGMDTPVTLVAMTATFPRRARFSGVRLLPGQSTLRASATDPAGNMASVTGPGGAACTLEVGNPPSLSFTSPRADAVFTRTGDGNPMMAGYQGVTVTLTTDAPPGTAVSLSIAGGTALMGMVNAGGTVTFPGVTLPEGDAVTLAASTADVMGRGVGRANITVAVDTSTPTPPTMVATVVPAALRRAGTLRLSFVNGSDTGPVGARAVRRYDVRYAFVPLTATNFESAPMVSAPPTPGAPGSMGTVDIQGLPLGRSYYVAMRSFDAAGNPSDTIAATTAPVALDVIVDRFADTGLLLGRQVSGGYDLNGDMLPDVVVASSNGAVRIYFGSSMGVTATNFAAITGSSASFFGQTAASVGDINGDGLGDLVVGERGATSTPGRVYIYFGRRSWPMAPASLSTSDANVSIGGGTGEFAQANFGLRVVRLGDFNGDGMNDFAVSATNAGNVATPSDRTGAVCLFFGRASASPWPTTLSPSAANLIIHNATASSAFGAQLTGLGRVVGGDAREDLGVGMGTSSVNPNGTVFVFNGRDVPAATRITSATATLTLNGSGGFGQTISAGVGDINGDGRGDITLSSIRGVGSVQLYFGDAAGSLTAGPSIAPSAGGSADAFGSSVASLVDPTALRPSLLSPLPTAADLLTGENVHLGATAPTLSIFRGRSSWVGVNSAAADKTIVAPTTMPGAEAIVSTTWVGDIDGDRYPDAAFGQFFGQGAFFIIR